ncbi:HAD-IA family hydrolase [Corynebacterium sp. TAE3-ERU12]|uniref:HAD family hydrolase n=1 Tax=Corynebacterium sp. TAE3-ERU12 TaxID=2849491 RepID=UPI001C4689AF|nr:HAD-IA family hydrolase [Corynebacterium sp. TAE3-ERU12]MBV7294515.1 HAD-IA family hydrolase [Corynebacterium sp. TAE3-ERU12]
METTHHGAVLFDLDGVLTPTADFHEAAWGDMFRRFLEGRDVAPYSEADYYEHLDGRRRDEGIRSLLASRGIELPDGGADDSPEDDTVTGLGLRKNEQFLKRVREGIEPFPGSVRYLDYLAALPSPPQVAVVSSSRNAQEVLTAAGLVDRFEVIVDGNVAHEKGLAGKPAPDTYLFAATALGVEPMDATVVEDAISGVKAGAAGRFGHVIGVDRGAGHDQLSDAGADEVVSDLAELVR